MMKRLLVPFIALCLGLHLQACSSSSSKDESDAATANDSSFAEEGEGDFADDSSSSEESTTSTDESTSTEQAATETPSEDAGDDLALGDETTETKTETTEANDELALDDTAPTGEVATTEEAPAAPTDEPLFEETKTETTETASTEPTPAPEESAPVEPEPVAEAPKPVTPVVYAPLLKVKDSAYTAADGTSLNRVYVARPKDTAKSVSQKIYGSNRSKDLVKWNPVLRRGMRTGDKIYYSSPTNPSDTRMITYFEEQNIPPQNYVSKPGDNIRVVSKDLLGFNDAWKEVWVTNPAVESKGSLPAGTELRYWPESESAPAIPVAANTALPPKDETGGLPEAAPAPPASNLDPMAPPPPNDQMAATDPMAPPPATDPNAAASVAQPPPQEIVPPPPPPPPIEVPKVAERPPVARPTAEAAEGMDADTTMIIGLGGILLIAAAVLFVVIRKNRAKRMDLSQTQI